MANEKILDDAPVSQSFLAGVLDIVAKATGKKIREENAQLKRDVLQLQTKVGALCLLIPRGNDGAQKFSELETLLARVKSLEERPAFNYRGVYVEGDTYQKGDLCTHSGSMHYCWRDTTDTPNQSGDWQCCVKRGRDAK